MGLTTRDQSPPIRAAPDPRQLALQQYRGYPMIGGSRYRIRRGINRNIFAGERSAILSRRHRTRHGIKRYRTPRSRSDSSHTSTKRRRSLPPTARRITPEYTSSASDEEPMDEVSSTDDSIQQNYLLRSVMEVFFII